jgi:hypothetical protein
MTRYIDAHKAQYGVEPICRVLEIAPSTYYAAANRLPCTRVGHTNSCEGESRVNPQS